MSSDRLVTRMVALSSAGQARRGCEELACLGPTLESSLGARRCFLVYQLGIRVPSLPHLCGWAAWILRGGWPHPADLVARTSLSCSEWPEQAPALDTKSIVESDLTLGEQRDRTTHILAQTRSFKATGIWWPQ